MGLRLLIKRLKELPNSAGAEHPALLYMDSWLNTETEAATKYPDSRVLKKDGTQLTYGKCAKGTDYPLFFGTDSNSYGKQLDLVSIFTYSKNYDFPLILLQS